MTRCTSRAGDRFSEFLLHSANATRRRDVRMLRSAARVARRAGYPSLAATHLDSAPLAAWWRRISQDWAQTTRAARFGLVRRYFGWFYERGVIEAYALRWIRGREVAKAGWMNLRLDHPLQRAIDAHVASLDRHYDLHRARVQHVLLDFERFWNLRGGALSRTTVVAWMRHRVGRYRNVLEPVSVGILRRFLNAHPEVWRRGKANGSPAHLRAIPLVRALRAGERIPRMQPVLARTELTPHWRKFVRLKRSVGHRYDVHEEHYRQLDRFLVARGFARLDDLTPTRIEEFLLARAATRSTTFEILRRSLHGLFQHLVARGALRADPTARLQRRGTASPPPRVFSHQEIAALLEAARSWPGEAERGRTIYTIFHLLYACGLRAGELCRLGLQDVDLANRCLRIRQTKFFKDRLVPFNLRVAENLKAYFDWRLRRYPPRSPDEAVFISRHHRGLRYAGLFAIFEKLRRAAGIHRVISEQRAGLHGLRRAFACHRLLRWYREGVDVDAKLPFLATYMGHRQWEYTQVYLTMTPALMRTAATRFLPRFQETVGGAP